MLETLALPQLKGPDVPAVRNAISALDLLDGHCRERMSTHAPVCSQRGVV